jgi:D-proline reductase (dithiol) PrdB
VPGVVSGPRPPAGRRVPFASPEVFTSARASNLLDGVAGLVGHLAGALTTVAPGEKPMTFAPDHDVPIPYMQRTRDYYQALGFAPYRWAHFADVPFTPLRAPLAQARLALITTAAPYQPGVGDQGPGAKYNAAAKFYKVYSVTAEGVPDLRISHVGYDRVHTTAEDARTWLPLAALQAAVKAGRIGALTPRFHGAPTNRSQRVTMETDAPELLARCREDGADVAVLVPS